MTTPPIQLTATIVGFERVSLDMTNRSHAARLIMRKRLRRGAVIVQNTVKFQFLSGQALHKRTGRLINSINIREQESPEMMSETIGTYVPYGRFWELGFHGVEHVNPFVRRQRSRNVRGVREDLKSGRGRIAEGVAFVRAHDRVVNMAARPFLRPALQRAASQVLAELQAGTREIVQL